MVYLYGPAPIPVTMPICMALHPSSRYMETFEITTGRHFREVPDWNALSWPTETLRELTRPTCGKHGVDPATEVPDDTEMSPVEAKDGVRHTILHMEPGS